MSGSLPNVVLYPDSSVSCGARRQGIHAPLVVIFGEPDVEVTPAGDEMITVKVKGVDVFHPNTGEVRSDGAEGIACLLRPIYSSAGSQ